MNFLSLQELYELYVCPQGGRLQPACDERTYSALAAGVAPPRPCLAGCVNPAKGLHHRRCPNAPAVLLFAKGDPVKVMKKKKKAANFEQFEVGTYISGDMVRGYPRRKGVKVLVGDRPKTYKSTAATKYRLEHDTHEVDDIMEDGGGGGGGGVR